MGNPRGGGGRRPSPRARTVPRRPPRPPERPVRRRGRALGVLALLAVAAAVAVFVGSLLARGGEDEATGPPPPEPFTVALGHFPRGAPLVLEVPADTNALEWRNLARLRAAAGVEIPVLADLRAGELAPLLAGPLAVGLAAPGEPLVAGVARDQEALAEAVEQRVAERRLEPLGRRGRYRAPGAGVVGTRGRILVAARSEQQVNRALERGEVREGLPRAAFERAVADLPPGSFVRGLVRVDALLPDRFAAVPWLAAMRTGGLALSLESDRARLDARLPTPDLTLGELPWVPGSAAATVPETLDPVRIGVSDAAQALRVLQASADVVREGGGLVAAGIGAALATAGVALKPDVIEPLGAGALVAGGGRTAVMVDPDDPVAFADVVRRATPLVPTAMRLAGRPGTTVRGLDTLTLVENQGEVLFSYGVVDGRFVGGTGPAAELSTLATAPRTRGGSVRGPVAVAIEPEASGPVVARMLGLTSSDGEDLPIGPLEGWLGGTETLTELQLTLALE